MVLVGIGMLVVGVLLGGILIYLWVRPKPEPAPDPQPPEPPPERQRRVTREMDTVAFEDVFDSWLGERPTNHRWRATGGGLFQTRTITVTRVGPRPATPGTPAPGSATAPSVPSVQAQPSVTLFDHLSKEDDLL